MLNWDMTSEISTNPAQWLQGLLRQHGCQTGALHRAIDGSTLELIASIGVPETVLPKIAAIPFGKGIAGVAAETREAVELCNLQQDLGGVAEAGARETQVSGSLAVPILSAGGNQVLGTLGIGMFAPHDFSDDEKASLAEAAAVVSKAWS